MRGGRNSRVRLKKNHPVEENKLNNTLGKFDQQTYNKTKQSGYRFITS